MFQHSHVKNPLPTQKNPLERRRKRAPLKIPHGLPSVICTDKQLLKACSIWLELKPLYYSGVFFNAKSRSAEFAEFLNMGESTFRKYIKLLERAQLVRYDHNKNMILCSWGKFRSGLGIKSRKHYTLYNDGRTTLKIRSLAIHESREQQQQRFFEKFYVFTRYNEYVNGQLAFAPDSMIMPLQRYEDQVRSTSHKKKEKKAFAQFVKNPATLHQATKLYDQHIRCGERCPEFNPCFTLSCIGVARKFGCNTPSAGHYWEKKLRAAGLLEMTPRSARVDQSSVHRQVFEGNNGSYSRPNSRKPFERVYFRTLPNQLIPVLPKPDWREYAT